MQPHHKAVFPSEIAAFACSAHVVQEKAEAPGSNPGQSILFLPPIPQLAEHEARGEQQVDHKEAHVSHEEPTSMRPGAPVRRREKPAENTATGNSSTAFTLPFMPNVSRNDYDNQTAYC